MVILLLFIVAAIVGIIAGCITYFITYSEYEHHFKGKRVSKEALASGFVSFVFFFFVTVVVALVLYRLFK